MTSKKILIICIFEILIFGMIPNVYSQGCDFSYAGEILPNGEVPDFIGYGLGENKKYTVEWLSNITGVVAIVFTTENFNIWLYGDHDDFSLAKKVDLTGHFIFNSGQHDILIMYNGIQNYAWVAYTLECEDIFAIPFSPGLLLTTILSSIIVISIFKIKKMNSTKY